MKKSAAIGAAPDYLALAESQLRETTLRTTDARIKVLAVLLEAHHAFSHQDIQDTLPDMDRVTLYRALDGLTDVGLTHKIAGDDRVFRYNVGSEQAGKQIQQHQHGHFKCTRCAKVFCIDNADTQLFSTDAPTHADSASALRQQLQSVVQASLGKGFLSHEIELTIKGWCVDCAH